MCFNRLTVSSSNVDYLHSPYLLLIGDRNHRVKPRGNKGKPVIAISLVSGLEIKKYSTQTQAAAELGIPPHYIFLCLRGLRLDAGGFDWQYASGKTSIIDFSQVNNFAIIPNLPVKYLCDSVQFL